MTPAIVCAARFLLLSGAAFTWSQYGSGIDWFTWADAPYVADSFTVNVADLLSRWTGERWRSTRHWVLPPPEQAPDEELISLIVFLEAEMDTVISPVAGNRELAPVVAGDWYRTRESAATVPSA